MLFDKRIPIEAKDTIKQYLYIRNGRGISERFLYRYWEECLNLVPITTAPNVLSVLGLISSVVPCLLLLYYNATGVGVIPTWVHFLSAAGIFLHQTFDELDGMQSRRVGIEQKLNGAPFESEWIDHAFDSGTCVCNSISITIGLDLKSPYLILALLVMAEVTFYSVHWRLNQDRVKQFDPIDVIEAQLGCSLIMLIAGAGWSSIWQIKMPYFNFSIGTLFVCAGVLTSLKKNLDNLKVIFTARKDNYLRASIPLILWLGAVFALIMSPNSADLLNRHYYLLGVLFSLCFIKINHNILLINMIVTGKVVIFDAVLATPYILIANLYLAVVDSKLLLIALIVFNICSILLNHYLIAIEMRDVMYFPIFSIPDDWEYPDHIKEKYVHNRTGKLVYKAPLIKKAM